MEEKHCSVILIASRKGGVGKSSIGLSTHLQLVASGKKSLYLDLDTQGTHFSQVLPTSGWIVSKNGEIEFDREGFLDEDTWFNSGITTTRRAPIENFPVHSIQLGDQFRQNLVLGIEEVNGKDAGAVVNRLCSKEAGLMICSPYIQQVTLTNKVFISGQDSQEWIGQWLDYLIDYAKREGYEYLVIDNSPGLSYNPSTVFRWAQFRRSSNNLKMHIWLVANSHWWEAGQTLYEASFFRKALKHCDYKLLINRVGNSWNGLRPGTSTKLSDSNEGSGKDALGAVLDIPVFLSQPKFDQVEKLLPIDAPASLCTLRDDTKHGSREEDSDPSVSYVTKAQSFIARFILGSVTPVTLSDGDASFHRDVWNLLSQPLIDPKVPATEASPPSD